MSNGNLNRITNFILGIPDDVLRDLYVRGKYRDVVLPMTVLRRLDAVLVILDELAPASSSSRPTSRPTWTSSRPTSRTFWTASSSEPFKKFSDNPAFKKWLADTIFSVAYTSDAA